MGVLIVRILFGNSHIQLCKGFFILDPKPQDLNLKPALCPQGLGLPGPSGSPVARLLWGRGGGFAGLAFVMAAKALKH